jgi:hypothetical protein
MGIFMQAFIFYCIVLLYNHSQLPSPHPPHPIYSRTHTNDVIIKNGNINAKVSKL